MERAEMQRVASIPGLEFRPIGGRFGVEVRGTDLSGDVSEDVFAAIADALHDHLVVAVRGQSGPWRGPPRLSPCQLSYSRYICRRAHHAR